MENPITQSWHKLSAAEVCTHLGSATDRGLLQADAARRLAQFGANTLPGEQTKSLWRMFVRQFASPLI